MERDNEIALGLLCAIRDGEDILGIDERNLLVQLYGADGGFSPEDVYHLRLLVDAGYILKEEQEHTGIHSFRMSWSGHDLCELLLKKYTEFERI